MDHNLEFVIVQFHVLFEPWSHCHLITLITGATYNNPEDVRYGSIVQPIRGGGIFELCSKRYFISPYPSNCPPSSDNFPKYATEKFLEEFTKHTNFCYKTVIVYKKIRPCWSTAYNNFIENHNNLKVNTKTLTLT